MRIAKSTILKDLSDVKIVYIDGNEVRNERDIEFALGGHYYRYSFIPQDEIWIEQTLKDSDDEVPIIVHEIVERLLMKNNGASYDEAHESANTIEKIMRGQNQEDFQ